MYLFMGIINVVEKQENTSLRQKSFLKNVQIENDHIYL